MKKILASFVMIVLASSVGVGATRAYFTDTATLNDETFSTGTLKMGVTEESYYVRMGQGVRTETPVHFVNLKPGDVVRQWITVHNAGSLPIDYLTVGKDAVSDSTGLLSQIVVSAGAGSAIFTRDWDVTKPTIGTWFVPSDVLDTAVYGTPAGIINPGEDYVMSLTFTVPTTVGNGYQGATASFNMVFNAEQVH